MEHCKTCRFWKHRPIAYPRLPTSPEQKGGICENEHLVESSPFLPDNLVYPYDEGAAFWTGPEFGCVHHGPRKEDDTP